MASPIPHDLLTAREVADVMRVSTMTVYRLIKAGTISKQDGLKFSPNPQQLEMNLKGIFIKS